MFRDVDERSGVFMARETRRQGGPRVAEGNVNHDTLVVIPAHNEAATVVQVARRARQACPFADVIVVNDGSQDETGELCHCAGIPVIDLPVNLGLAGAFRTGMQYAMRHGYRFAVQLDADGQHDPTAVEPMRERALSGVNIGFLPMGDTLGRIIGGSEWRWTLVPLGMLLGYLVVAAAPAVHVLNEQVEQVTSGAVAKDVMMKTMSVGVSVSIGLAMLRMLLGFSVW